MSPSKIKIAARHSDLARLQALRVGDALKSAHPGLEISYAFRASLGDQNLEDPLWKMPERGVFTEDFVRDLEDGSADLVVHSWKDLPTEPRPGLEIAATLPRADSRDLLLFRRDQTEHVRSTKRLRVLTSSPRRAFNLDSFFRTYLPFEIADVVFENVRGNIPTRMRKLLSGEADALIVAKAAVDRLLDAPESEFKDAQDIVRQTLAQTRQMVLPLSLNPTAAAQGALAVEIRSDRTDLKALLQAVHSAETFAAVMREREILSSYGGGCHQKIGVSVLDRPYGRVTFLQGLTDAGERLNQIALDTLATIPKCKSADHLFPNEADAPFFERKYLPSKVWSKAETAKFLWISRETALPQAFHIHPEALVWTSGLKTWAKLAAKGIWVTGSAEGLGEHEGEQLESIAKVVIGSAPVWTKLTHQDAVARQPESSATQAVATYALTPSPKAADLNGRTHFYWMSGTTFDRASELYPELLQSGIHASGPGSTHEHLKVKLKNSTPFVYLNVEQFRRAAL